jgi:hypothetical protein
MRERDSSLKSLGALGSPPRENSGGAVERRLPEASRESGRHIRKTEVLPPQMKKGERGDHVDAVSHFWVLTAETVGWELGEFQKSSRIWDSSFRDSEVLRNFEWSGKNRGGPQQLP